jgi:anti-sigma factor RsiW
MSPCEQYSIRILNYLDGRLQGQELDDFRAHVNGCSSCRAKIEEQQSLSQLLRRARPLYSAPPALRAGVALAVEQHTATKRTRENLYERLLWVVESPLADPARRFARLRLAAATLAVAAVLLAFVPNAVREVRATSYVDAAVAAHRSYLDGHLGLGLHSSSPQLVTAWFANKVPFQFRLPNSATPSTQPVYHLTGAGLLSYRGRPTAFVTYERQNEKVSLLVASSESAIVAGGDEVRSDRLIFHYRTDQGFKVVTWNNHGLSYALVSSVSGSARESCMVCHQSMADQQKFRSGL